MSGLRLLYLHQHYSGPGGATATRAHAMARALAARGHEVTLACGRYEGAETGLSGPYRGGRRRGRVSGFEVVEFDLACGNAQGLARRGGAFLRYAARATGLALSRPWDLVLASSTPLTVALPALAARRLRGVPFVFEIRDPWPKLPRAMSAAGYAGRGLPGPALWGMERLADAACRGAAAVVALTEGMAETALVRGAAPGRVHVVPNGCDLDLFGPHRPRWRPPEAAPWEALAVYAGAHGRANGLDVLIEAAALLRERGGSRLRIVLAGEGGERVRLSAEAARRGLDNVTVLGPLPKERLAGLLAGAQIGLHLLAPVPAFAEWTAPNKLMDYLAAGLPVVTNAPGRAARIVEDRSAGSPAGLAAPPGDAAALAAALAALVSDPARRAAMGAAARLLAQRRWDRRLHAARLCEVVERAARLPLPPPYPAPRPA